MTFLIAAAGTGGHVYPGLSVGEALVELGVDKSDIVYVGGDRLESVVYPGEGFRFLGIELAGLKRSLTLENLKIPYVVARARRAMTELIAGSGVRVVIGMGGYVTIPAALAARKRRVAFYNAEQNAGAGLANRITARWALETFVSFPATAGLPHGRWVGNPVRRMFWEFDRPSLIGAARDHYELSKDVPTLGVFGGSLGAGVINDAVAGMLERWKGDRIDVVHLTGKSHLESLGSRPGGRGVNWLTRAFEERMDLFYAACDLVIARAGGAVAELTATGTPSVLIPGRFGSTGHQAGNARFLEQAGAAVVIDQDALTELAPTVQRLLPDVGRLAKMTAACGAIAKPEAALTIAGAMIEAAV